MRSVYGDDFISGRSIAKDAWLLVDVFVYREAAAADSLVYVHPGGPGMWFWLEKRLWKLSEMPPSRHAKDCMPYKTGINTYKERIIV